MHTLNDIYKSWQHILINFPRLSRYTLGTKIDLLFCDVLEHILLAAYSPRHEKLPILHQASMKFDALKFFLATAWELKFIDTKK
ncbi:MAG: four helix bundle protein [Patescibacteria group bacterium]